MKKHTYRVELASHVLGENDLEESMDEVLDGFEGVHGVADVDVAVHVPERLMTVSMYVDAESRPDAIRAAENAFRTAIHASGGATPAWEEQVDQDLSTTVSRSDLAHA